MKQSLEPISTLKKDQKSLLERLKTIEKLSEFLSRTSQKALNGLPLLTAQIKALQLDLQCHAQKEEQSLFSLMIDMERDQGAGFIVPLVTEHCDLETRCNELETALDSLGSRQGEERRWQMLKIKELMHDLAELLRDHLHTELKNLFPHILQMLDSRERALVTEQMDSIQNRYEEPAAALGY